MCGVQRRVDVKRGQEKSPKQVTQKLLKCGNVEALLEINFLCPRMFSKMIRLTLIFVTWCRNILWENYSLSFLRKAFSVPFSFLYTTSFPTELDFRCALNQISSRILVFAWHRRPCWTKTVLHLINCYEIQII